MYNQVYNTVYIITSNIARNEDARKRFQLSGFYVSFKFHNDSLTSM